MQHADRGARTRALVQGTRRQIRDVLPGLALGLRRARQGPLVAYVVSWSGLAVLLWTAAFGAVLGLLVTVGAVSDTDLSRALFTAGAARHPTPWQVAGGALAGAGGSVETVAWWLFGSFRHVGLDLATGLVSALVIAVATVCAEGELLRLARCRPPTIDELRRLSRVLQHLDAHVETGQEPWSSPRFLMVDSDDVFLRVRVRHVVLSTALPESLDDEELAAALSHALHHWRAGDAAARMVLVACGWPVLALYALGVRLGSFGRAGQRRRLVSDAAWLVLWPCWVLVHLALVPAVARTTARQEYEADGAARRAGHGPGLISAMRKAPRFETEEKGPTSALTCALPPGPLRIEKLTAVRPLDAFFRGHGPSAAAGPPQRRWATIVAGALAFLLGIGAARSAGNASSLRAEATARAVSFTVSYLDAAFDQDHYHAVLASFIPASLARSAERSADESALGVAALIAAGHARHSHAIALSCRYLSSSGAAPTRPAPQATDATAEAAADAAADVAVRVRWDYTLDGLTRQEVLTSTVPLSLGSGGDWHPTGVPSLTFGPQARQATVRCGAGNTPAADHARSRHRAKAR